MSWDKFITALELVFGCLALIFSFVGLLMCVVFEKIDAGVVAALFAMVALLIKVVLLPTLKE